MALPRADRFGAINEKGRLPGRLNGQDQDTVQKNSLKRSGSLAHSLRKRPPNVTSGLQNAVRLVGSERLYQMIEVCPLAILNNQFNLY